MDKRVVILILIVSLSLVFGLLSIKKGHIWGDDWALFMTQAESLLDGSMTECLLQNKFTVENSTSPTGPYLYPWGFPLMLFPIYATIGESFFAMKLLILLHYLTFLLALFLVFRSKMKQKYIYILILVMAINPRLLDAVNMVISDIPFAFISLLSIWFLDRCIIKERYFLNKAFSYTLLGIAIFMAYFLKASGGLLLIVLFFTQFHEKKISWKLKILVTFRESKTQVIPYIVFAILFALVHSLLPFSITFYSPYLRIFSIVEPIINLGHYAYLFASFFGSSMLSKILFIISLPFLVYGIVKTAKKYYLFPIFCFLYALLLIMMPFRQGIRYIIPLLPFYLFFTIKGFIALSDRSGRLGACIVTISAYSILILYLCNSGVILYENIGIKQITDGPYTEKSAEMFDFIKTHTKNEDVIVFFKPRAMRLITKRRAIRITQPEQLDRGDYIVMCDQKITTHQVSDDVISENESKREIRKIYANGEFSVYLNNK